MVPTTGIAAAVAELRRVAKLPGIRTVLLSQWPNGSPVPEPDVDNEFWAAAIETGVPLSVHGSFGGGRAAEMRNADPTKPQLNGLITRQGLETGYCVTQLIMSRVFERFPGLRFSFAETGAGWVPFYSEQADTNYERHRYWWDFELEHPPSYYVRHHFLWGIQDDYVCIELRHHIGTENIMWATDFPHHATDWPAPTTSSIACSKASRKRSADRSSAATRWLSTSSRPTTLELPPSSGGGVAVSVQRSSVGAS